MRFLAQLTGTKNKLQNAIVVSLFLLVVFTLIMLVMQLVSKPEVMQYAFN